MTPFCCKYCRISALNITARDEMLKCLFISCDVLLVDFVPSARWGGEWPVGSISLAVRSLDTDTQLRHVTTQLGCSAITFRNVGTILIVHIQVVHVQYVSWDVTPCNLIGLHRRFGQRFCLHLQGWSIRQSLNKSGLLVACFSLIAMLVFPLYREYRGSIILRNVGELPNYKVSSPNKITLHDDRFNNLQTQPMLLVVIETKSFHHYHEVNDFTWILNQSES
jgi:hypothetical protein